MLKKTDIQKPELWDFPMDYPIHIIGVAGDELASMVKLIFSEHVPEFDLAAITVQPSKTGKYHSLRATLPLTHHQQVNNLYAALAQSPLIKTVL